MNIDFSPRNNNPGPVTVPEWLEEIGDLPDHYHGQTWHSGVMPNNFLFFLRTRAEQLVPLGVTHNLHHRHELVINYAGGGTMCIGENLYRFEPGCAILLPPGTFHYYFNVPEKGFKWLFFTFELQRAPTTPDGPGHPVRLGPHQLQRLEKAARLYLSNGTDLDVFEAGLAMGRVLMEMAEAPPKLTPAVDMAESDLQFCALLRKLTRLVDANMHQAVRIRDLADALGLSESHLRKRFREQTGDSLGAYLQRSRITRGVQLIHNGELSISEVAIQYPVLRQSPPAYRTPDRPSGPINTRTILEGAVGRVLEED